MQLAIFPKLTEVLVVKEINCLTVLPMSAITAVNFSSEPINISVMLIIAHTYLPLFIILTTRTWSPLKTI